MAAKVRGSCAGCDFWLRKNEGRAGECRRFPPQVIYPIDKPDPGYRPRPEHYFPVSLEHHWCGEFEERPDAV